jgi:hypothetical protein
MAMPPWWRGCGCFSPPPRQRIADERAGPGRRPCRDRYSLTHARMRPRLRRTSGGDHDNQKRDPACARVECARRLRNEPPHLDPDGPAARTDIGRGPRAITGPGPGSAAGCGRATRGAGPCSTASPRRANGSADACSTARRRRASSAGAPSPSCRPARSGISGASRSGHASRASEVGASSPERRGPGRTGRTRDTTKEGSDRLGILCDGSKINRPSATQSVLRR